MQNGLYKVSFRTPIGAGDGVVYLRDGQLWGGDSSMYYRGSYVVAGDQFSAQVTSDIHSRPAGMESVFGVDHAQISLSGRHTGTAATLSGSSTQAPGVGLTATMSRLAD
jgi:hypothetical protein